MSTLLEGKAEKTLNERYQYREGVMTRREFMQMLKANSGTVEEKQIRKHAAEEVEREALRRSNHPWGNEKHPATIAFEKRKAALAEGFFKAEYRARRNGSESFTVITKIEFYYFNTL